MREALISISIIIVLTGVGATLIGQEIVNDKQYWRALIQMLPSSYNQKSTVMLNYEVLANMYHSRKAHKLDEWREFCKWVETLPYSELITGSKGE